MLKSIKRKAIVCDMNKPEEKELWEWLQILPHGKFSEETKRYWMDKMTQNIKSETERINREFAEGKYSAVYGHHEEKNEGE